MTKALYLIALISILAIIGPASATVACSKEIYAFPGQHIELQAATTGSNLEYYWWTDDAGWSVMENGVAANLRAQKVVFDAPDTVADYTLKVLVSESSARGCFAEDCVTIHVIKCCPDYTSFCESDTVSLCWYDSCYTSKTVPTLVHATTLTYNWYVNGATDPITGTCITPSFEASPWLSPSGTGFATNSLVLVVTQSAHGTTKVLYTCAQDFLNIYAAPQINSIDVVSPS
jgi:hypothetical protein